MKKFNMNGIVGGIAVLAVSLTFGLTGPISANAAGPAAVDLLSISTNNFAILSQTGITNTGSHTTAITGNIGSSPITAAAMNGVFCSEITGLIYGVDAGYIGSGSAGAPCGAPGPGANKTLVDSAVADMMTAYTDAAGRTAPAPVTELGAGNIGGMTLAPGLYKWSTNVTIPTDVTLSGGANDVWIFQIAEDLSIAPGGSVPTGVKVILSGGAQASNVFWQVGGPTGATLGTYSTFNGTILSAKQVIIMTGAVLNGRALAQTQVTLDANTVTASVSVVDTTAPSITLNGGASMTVFTSNGFTDPGFTASDSIDGSPTVVVTGTVNASVPGTYTLTYTATDDSDNQASVTRTVLVLKSSSGGRGGSSSGGSSASIQPTATVAPVAPIGQVLGAFTGSERLAQIANVKASLVSLIRQLVGLLQVQLAAAIQAQNN